jgi:hypothetical protein
MLVLANEPPPTIFMAAPRTTNPNWQQTNQQNWQQNQPIQTWQNPQMSEHSQYSSPMMQSVGRNQNLPLISLILGVTSFSGLCCSFLGIPLSLGAIITGYIGMTNANNNPTEYGGKGLAIGGLITGAITLLLFSIILFIWLIGSIS